MGAGETVVAALATAEGQTQTLQMQLLADGFAYVYPAEAGPEIDHDEALEQMLATERAARLAGLGYLAAHPDIAVKRRLRTQAVMPSSAAR
jgi:endonuclease YncB( thermonuclease family)